ncbi:ATP-dependent helicase [Cellulomonas pakistanensis]|uniref:ATP-dependent helicase n=1 Tax=Cellulomonas pakistanensis TaxID=992287 RepID=UPI001EF1CB86|nr:UrvD/REP family ATP-dependent DNA helicase [Cellulomonas pakistanensis]
MNPTPAAPPPAGGLRLVRPALADAPAPVRLGADQRAVVDRVVAGTHPALLVVGAAGTGKTLLAVEAVAAALGADDDGLFPSPDLPSPDEVLVLASGRRAAAELRDRIGGRVRRTTGQAMVRTPAAAAFAVLRARAALLGDPAPTLISGPEQDLALAELLAGHAAGEGVPLRWPAGVPEEALTLRAFRGELRDLVMRAAERGVEPEDLAALGERHGRPEWVAAAALYREYVDVTTLRAGTPDAGARYDPAVVVEEAAEVLRHWEDELPGPRPRWRLVVVDDYQEATEATARLLRVLQDDGARLLLLADPDAAVQTFRGATPALVGRADVAGDGPGELGATRLVLDGVRRHGPVLRGVAARVAERVAVVGGAAHRRALPVPGAGDAGGAPVPAGVPTQGGAADRVAAHDAGGADGADVVVPRDVVRAAVLPSPAQEAAWVAHALRRAHLEDGTPWAEMAVIARSGGQVTALRRALGSAQVPVAVVGSDVPLRDEPAVRPLLDALRVALGPDAGGSALDAELAARLCCSPLGGLDAVGLRRLRRSLRAEEVALGGGRASDELLVEVLLSPALAAGLQPVVRRPVARIATVLAEGRAAAAAPGADAQGVLWAIWDASGLAEPWRRSALAGGPGGARADRDLDAVLALFRAAETFVDRMPQARAAAFLEWVEAQELPSDTIAARARRDAVSVLTPAGAAGREWDVVVVAGVQEGVWPDLRLRDSLLGSQALVDVLAGRGAGRAAAADAPADAHAAAEAGAAARAAVLADELRSFHVAVSRARRVLLVTAVSDEDDQPSPFLDLVEPNDEDDDPRRTVAPAPLDLRGLVAQLRGRLEQAARDGVPDPEAAGVLARLADEGVPGADPAEWHGLAEPSSDAPLWAEGQRVPVSPSRIETAGTCTLRWALEAAGGTAPSSARQSLGTLVHALAQTHPRGGREELLAELDRRWPELGLGHGWPATLERRRAEAMVGRLADYLAHAGEPLAIEARFELELDRAVVRGTLDRVERADADAADGPDDAAIPVRVVDLKTGRTAPSAQEATTNPQLGAYQLAVDAGAVEGLPPGATSAGAQLVFVSDVNKNKAALREQPALGPDAPDDPSWARTHIEEVAERMAASSFAATANTLCDRCPVRRSCPLRDEGGQVVA